MAIDEALLLHTSLPVPVLRHYRWLGRCASFGVSQPVDLARTSAPDFELVRRWTGGGVVRHDADWTFSLLIPASNPASRVRPRELYHHIHLALSHALADAGVPSRLAAPTDEVTGPECFRAPACLDLLTNSGTKICGGAQRRCRQGTLHQGSVQQVVIPDGFTRLVANHLATHDQNWTPPTTLLHIARTLDQEKYSHPQWTAKK